MRFCSFSGSISFLLRFFCIPVKFSAYKPRPLTIYFLQIYFCASVCVLICGVVVAFGFVWFLLRISFCVFLRFCPLDRHWTLFLLHILINISLCVCCMSAKCEREKKSTQTAAICAVVVNKKNCIERGWANCTIRLEGNGLFFSHNIPRISMQTKLKSIFGKCEYVEHCQMLCAHAVSSNTFTIKWTIFFFLF